MISVSPAAAVAAPRYEAHYCASGGDFCEAIYIEHARRYIAVYISSESHLDLCVTAPTGDATCKSFALRSDGDGTYSSTIPWSKHFPAAGGGIYRVAFEDEWGGPFRTMKFHVAGRPIGCHATYRDRALPVYDRFERVLSHRLWSCLESVRIANAVADAYERGLPLRNLPPPPTGVPGGSGKSFALRTHRYGTFSCTVTGRGSDFVDGVCRRRGGAIRFESLNHWYLHGQ